MTKLTHIFGKVWGEMGIISQLVFVLRIYHALFIKALGPTEPLVPFFPRPTPQLGLFLGIGMRQQENKAAWACKITTKESARIHEKKRTPGWHHNEGVSALYRLLDGSSTRVTYLPKSPSVLTSIDKQIWYALMPGNLKFRIMAFIKGWELWRQFGRY